MTTSTLSKALGALIVAALVVAGFLLFMPGGTKMHLTAEFPRTVSLYSGSDVRILGVRVGSVDSVTPAGTKVVVKMTYDAKYKVPKNAKAVLVSPSIVGDRFIQLTPAYTKGAVMADHTVLSQKRTATPLELDQIYGSLNDLSVALGPDGANSSDGGTSEGALTRILDSTSRNFDGQGVQAHQTIENLSRLTKTLDDNKENLFGTAKQLETFVNALATNDDTVRRFNDSLTQGADLLAGERQDLAAALKNLGTALVDVRQFVETNRDALTTNIKGLNQVTQILVKRRDQLAEVLKVAPTALNNLGLAYNPKTGTLDQRTNLSENITNGLNQPGTVLCGFLAPAGQVLSTSQCTQFLNGIGLKRAGALTRSSTPDNRYQYVDPTLAGLVEVKHR
ncbi:MCE family protein [Nocardioides mangrovicus]|uniref:MCE family protein n=1 Tax=Nocardioides mangrovicus TaxID=2478913 RepID=A0A3L8P861_9ACTN|nr:MCE family protein [Nocardioides mangrovicus]RLV50598.1 MCE family protein [Nocardioides mangrovicus]